MNVQKSDLPRVVVIGGGFAGLNLVKKLRKLPVQLVMINKHNYHAFQPLLYQVSTSGIEPDSIVYPLRMFIKRQKNFYFRLADVKEINPESKTIIADIGELTYDYLIINTGTKTNFFGNKRIEKFAMSMKTIPQALNLRSLILQNFEKSTVVVPKADKEFLLNFVIVGAGPTGVELAGAIAEFKHSVLPLDFPDLDPELMQIHILEGADRVLPPMSIKSSNKSAEALKKLGVQIHTNTIVTDFDGTLVKTKDGKEFKTRTLIWSAGVIGNLIKGFSEESYNARSKRYYVDKYNKIKGYEDVFALGDIALMESEDYPNGHPQVAQPAIQQANNLSSNFKKILKGDTNLKSFKYKDKGSMATIGRNKAVADIGNLQLNGFLAWLVWMFIHLMALVGFRNRLIVFFNWIYNYTNYNKASRLIIRRFSVSERKVRTNSEL
ncbi:NAD(P)/FAD-dependent oxidoreductase [Polaribacter vadi]|uniref:NAD(P)/FAD-dependent oxidoreductase n=1 Tax=Polaribacter TaxID=52959 RepID=UPI001C092B02|nr:MULTISPECIES: NAD(P)/FAD-dependent oxidoreductase [Polaribacter]MBU3012729.1 NAD(P)/FAD-dependent oxidoreductase [Polaribacter vadi]MDO6742545.1 NAD(P)/FAD-dependent oxidoreductase [Polaribacter sp. 1_MG-2023]